jgi:D-alanyl-D-alanine carboxypeptidase/D-alanyl-D-alanine-endopeptidase (penicillin-binding protein 4)
VFYVANPKNSIPQWGSGWGWSDYDADYMAERNEFPVYGNIITITHNVNSKAIATGTNIFDRLLNGQLANSNLDISSGRFSVGRKLDSNDFEFKASANKFSNTRITFVTDGATVTLAVLRDLLQKNIQVSTVPRSAWRSIYSQSTDSLLRITMHRSDNFFAEQSLLMVSDKLLGYMDDDRIIDTLLKSDFKDLPQKPRWVDGCGLSRYNLFTPQDFVAILGKMRTDFGMNRVKNILATGGEGTISSYYKKDSGYIYAKTGTLAGVVALSGFLETKDHKQLIFSVLVNNHRSSATDVRRAVEQFLEEVRNRF